MGLRLLALLCLVGAAFAGPFQRETGSPCSALCSAKSKYNFEYDTQKTYNYAYSAENYLTIAGNRNQKAKIDGVAEITFPSKCLGFLKLKDLRISGESDDSELHRNLKHGVFFSFNDGAIEKLCPTHRDDSQHSLNIKRGLLAAFVNNMKKLDTPEEVYEHDSLGNCNTKYTTKYDRGLKITKVKDLKSCTNRHSLVTSLSTRSYDNQNAKVHNLPVLSGEYYACEQSIENQVIKNVVCKEKSEIKPLKRGSVAIFEGRMSLSLLRVSASNLENLEDSHGPVSILYNLEEQSDLQSRESEVKRILSDMCSKNNGVIDISVSRDFMSLVSSMKTLHYEVLKKFYQSLRHGRICSSKKVLDLFVDALPMAASDAAIKLLVELIERKEITGLKAKLWPASLALIPKPTRETIAAIKPLLMMVDSAPVMLGVSAMLHRFCSTENCDIVSEVQEIIKELHKKLSSSSSDDRVFSVLKAFGNIGYHGKARADILRCAKDSSKPMRLRLAAVDAFRRVLGKRPQELLDIYLNRSEDPELRILAFSTAMKYADDQQLDSIKEAIEKETNSQVSGYAKSFIQNMNKTSSPLKKEVRNLLKNYEINHPKSDYWSNSKNFEMSAHSEALNVGASVEGDIIHSNTSKLPRSVYSRLDIEAFGNSLNMFEMGFRAEGIEALLQNFLGLKDKIPKIPKWDIKSIFADNNADASLFLRTMNVEIFDLAASDLTAMGELIKIAELMTKLSHERKADFSHSFLFLNSKLIIPSVTGRSYSLDLTGSATVALTASTKFDLLSFPRSVDIQAHFQPSVNVEISTTLGIQSSRPRPDIKLVSRMHAESNLKTKIQVKDGHVAVAKLSLPSENVLLTKFSSDVFEIDADHNEKRVFDKMQKKMDYCYDKLEKPLGISVCGKWEVPKPFVVKSFPFIQGVGNVEFAIKKTDSSFSSYEVAFEIPKHHGHHMRYTASLDTPGSKVNRRFAAELDLKHRSKGQRQFSLELTSPFKRAGGSGSLIHRSDLIQGSLEVHSGSSPIFSFNASTAISKSRLKTVCRSHLRVSLFSHDYVDVTGSISTTKGKKQQITVDIRSNKPTSRPVVIKGTIIKDGRIDFSKGAEWKISSDLDVRSPFGTSKIRGILEKSSSPISKFSTSIILEYVLRGKQKQFVRFSGLMKGSPSKSNSILRVESTEVPRINFVATWDRQRESSESLKNNVSIKYGLNHEKTYIIFQTKHSESATGHKSCQLLIKAPQFDIDSDATFTHSYKPGDSPSFHIEGDIRYKYDKHIRGRVDYAYTLKHLLKVTTTAEFECPGGKFSYIDVIEEVSLRHFKGKSKLQWREDKFVEIEYRYQNSERSGNRYELEGSLSSSSLPTPIKSKIECQHDEKSLNIEGELSFGRGSEYLMEVKLNKEGNSHASWKAPQAEGELKLVNEEQKKSLSWDFKLKTGKPRHIVGSALMHSESGRKFKFYMCPDADRHPEIKILAESVITFTKGDPSDSFNSEFTFQIYDFLTVSVSESGDNSLMGRYETTLEVRVKHHEPIGIKYEHQVSKSHTKSVITLSRNNVQCSQLELEGSVSHNGNQREISARAALKSLDNHFKNKEISLRYQISNSGSSTQIKSSVKIQHSPSKVYEAEWNSELQPSGVEMKAQVNTPHENYKKQSLDVSFQRSENAISSSVNIDIPNSRGISMSADVQTQSHGFTGTLKANKFLDIVQNVKIHLSVENEEHKKSISSYIDMNNARVADIEAGLATSSGIELKGHVKIAPVPNVIIQGISFSFRQTRSLQTFSGAVDLANNKHISVSTEIKEEGERISLTVSLNAPSKIKDLKAHVSVSNANDRNLLLYIDVNGERKGDAEIKVKTSSESFEVQARMKTSRTPEVSAHLRIERRDESFLISGKILKGTSPLWSTVLSKQKSGKGEKLIVKTESFQKTLLDLQISNEVSEDHMKFVLKASGRFSPVSLTLSSSSSEKSAVRMQISACKESPTNKCYTLKAYHKTMRNSGDYHRYRELTFDVEKSSEESKSESIGRVHFLITSSDHDYRSKVVLQYQEKNIGYEVRIHRRRHESDSCSMDLSVIMPHKTSHVRSSIVHSSKSMLLDVEVVLNNATPKQRFHLEMKRETHHNEVSGHIKMLCPDMTKPFLLKVNVEKLGLLPVRGKVELHYSLTSWFKVLTLEITNEKERSGIKSVVYRLYREDESLDVSMKFKKQISRYEDMYGYDWSCKYGRIVKKGGLSLTLSKSRSGKPESLEISYYSPNADLKVQGKSQWSQAPSESSLKVVSGGRVIKEIKILSRESCIVLDLKRRSGPFFNSSICFNKREGKTLKLVSIDAFFHEHKCLDVRVSVDPKAPTFVDVSLEWKKDDLFTALSELSGLKSLLRGRSLKELERELREKVHRLVKDKLKPHLREIVKTYKEMKKKYMDKLREALKGHSRFLKQHMENMKSLKSSFFSYLGSLIPWEYIEKEILTPLRNTIKCLIEGYSNLIFGHIPDLGKLIWEVTKKQFEHCLRKFCSPGTFCHEFVKSYERYGFRHTRKLIQKRIAETRRSLKEKLVKYWIPRFLSPWRLIRVAVKLAVKAVKRYIKIWLSPILTPWKLIRNAIKLATKVLEELFGKFVARVLLRRIVDFGKKIEDLVRQRAIDLVDYVIHKFNDWLRHAEKDEDFRTAVSLVKDAKRKAVQSWRRRDEIVREAWEPVQESISENVRKAINERFEMKKYKPTEGEIEFRIRNPLGPAQIELLKNELRKILQWFKR